MYKYHVTITLYRTYERQRQKSLLEAANPIIQEQGTRFEEYTVRVFTSICVGAFYCGLAFMTTTPFSEDLMSNLFNDTN